MKQLIIVRKDLHMSIAKFAVQCCHASMAFIKENKDFLNQTFLK